MYNVSKIGGGIEACGYHTTGNFGRVDEFDKIMA